MLLEVLSATELMACIQWKNVSKLFLNMNHVRVASGLFLDWR